MLDRTYDPIASLINRVTANVVVAVSADLTFQVFNAKSIGYMISKVVYRANDA